MNVKEIFTPSFEFERQYAFPVAGIDEAGIGSWIGPVVAGAVILEAGVPDDLLALLHDSKKLSEKKRDLIFDKLQEDSFVHIGVGEASLGEIKDLNIRNAGLLAMKRAVEALPLKPTAVLVDGTGRPNLDVQTKLIVKGDQRSYSIAAASIIAKVTRDRFIKKIAEEYPDYGWDRNAGYGTKQHQEALHRLGVTPWHRVTYAPIATLLEQA
jgi:ribonuclease HII